MAEHPQNALPPLRDEIFKSLSSGTRHRPLVSYVYVFLTACMFGHMLIFQSSLGPITDVLRSEFGFSSSDIGLLNSANYMMVLLFNIPWGLFLQIYTPELSVIIAAFSMSAVCVAFPFIGATSHSLAAGCIIRWIGGALTGHLWISVVTVAAHKFGNNNVGVISGLAGLIGACHATAGGIAQAALYERYQDWRSIFFVVGGMSFFYGILLLLCKWWENKRESKVPQQSTTTTPQSEQDGSPTVTALHAAVSRSSSFRRTDSNSFSGEKVSPREAEKMKLSLWQQTKLNLKQAATLYLNWTLGAIAFCAGVIYFGVFQLWMVPYLQTVYGYSRTFSTVVSGAGMSSYGVAVVAFGEVARRWKRRKALIFFSVACYLCLVILIYVPLLPPTVVVALAAMTGFGCGCIVIVFTLGREYNWFYGSAETASALINMIMVSSGVVSSYTIGTVLESRNSSESVRSETVYNAGDFQMAFLVVPVCVGLMLLLTLSLKETHGENVKYDGPKETESQSQTVAV